jgi:predicted nucleic-acid-binding protein
MIAVDTNVLVKFSGPGRSCTCTESETADLPLCEVVWVLTRGYRFERTDVADVLTKLITARQL